MYRLYAARQSNVLTSISSFLTPQYGWIQRWWRWLSTRSLTNSVIAGGMWPTMLLTNGDRGKIFLKSTTIRIIDPMGGHHFQNDFSWKYIFFYYETISILLYMTWILKNHPYVPGSGGTLVQKRFNSPYNMSRRSRRPLSLLVQILLHQVEVLFSKEFQEYQLG